MTDDSSGGPPTSGERPRLGVASSLASARPGEVVYAGRGGEVMTAARVRATKVKVWIGIAAVGTFIGVTYAKMFSPLAAVAALSGLGGLLAWRWSKSRALNSAMALTSLGRWEEAHAALAALDRGWLPQGFRPAVKLSLATTTSLLGQPEDCLRQLEGIEARRAWRVALRGPTMRMRLSGLRASVLASLGRAAEARAQRAIFREVIAAQQARFHGPEGEAFEFLRQATELDVAGGLDAPDDLPDNDTLHEWARAALARTGFGQMLLPLAWVFERRGDTAMARHLLAEAPARVNRWSLPTKNPRLWAWAEERQRAWELPPLRAELGDGSR